MGVEFLLQSFAAKVEPTTQKWQSQREYLTDVLVQYL